MALSFYLTKLGLLNKVIIPDEFSHLYNWINGIDNVLCASNNINQVKSAFSKADLIFCLDFNHRSRVGELISPLLYSNNNSSKIIVIDHHTYPENFGDYEIIDPEKKIKKIANSPLDLQNIQKKNSREEEKNREDNEEESAAKQTNKVRSKYNLRRRQ